MATSSRPAAGSSPRTEPQSAPSPPAHLAASRRRAATRRPPQPALPARRVRAADTCVVALARRRLPAAARGAARRPVRRRRLPGQPGRRGAVQPGAAGARAADVAAGFAVLLLPYSLDRPVRRRAARPLVAPAGARGRATWSGRCRGARRRRRDRRRGARAAVLRLRAGGRVAQPVLPVRAERRRCRTWSGRRNWSPPTRCRRPAGRSSTALGGGIAIAVRAPGRQTATRATR